MTPQIIDIIKNTAATAKTKKRFYEKLNHGYLTRQENPQHHLCVYFAAYDPDAQTVFIGVHRKSGLWLFNGGHMEPGESPADAVAREANEEWNIRLPVGNIPTPLLLTVTRIEHPERVICVTHFDIWYFLPVRSDQFSPDETRLSVEFFQFGWKPYDEARSLLRDTNSPTALALIRTLPYRAPLAL